MPLYDSFLEQWSVYKLSFYLELHPYPNKVTNHLDGRQAVLSNRNPICFNVSSLKHCCGSVYVRIRIILPDGSLSVSAILLTRPLNDQLAESSSTPLLLSPTMCELGCQKVLHGVYALFLPCPSQVCAWHLLFLPGISASFLPCPCDMSHKCSAAYCSYLES